MKAIISRILLLLVMIVSIFNNTPLKIQAEESNIFTVSEYTTFYVYTNPSVYPQGSGYGASGYALDLGDKVNDIQSITSVTITYNSCTWEVFGGCWSWENNQSLTVQSEQLMALSKTSTTRSTLPLVGPVQTLLDYRSDIPQYESIYGVMDTSKRTELASYDYYFVLDGEWVVTEVLLIKISYIEKATNEEVESVCTGDCDLGDTWDNMPELDLDAIVGGDLIQTIALVIGALLLIIVGFILVLFLANLKAIFGAIGSILMFVIKLPGYLYHTIVAILKFIISIPGAVWHIIVTVFIAARSFVVFFWQVIKVLASGIRILVLFIFKVIRFIVIMPFQAVQLIGGVMKPRKKQSKYGHR